MLFVKKLAAGFNPWEFEAFDRLLVQDYPGTDPSGPSGYGGGEEGEGGDKYCQVTSPKWG